MYQPMLFLHWKQIRMALIPFVLASFALPLLAVDGLGSPAGAGVLSLDAYRFMEGYQVWLPLFPALAGAIGVTLALSSWNWDHQTRHVYALSLPVSRSEYAMLKMGAGAALALLPAGAMWIGAHVAAASVTLPNGLHAYPNALALRFFLSILVTYALLFAMAAGSVKTTLRVLSALVALVLVGQLANDLVLSHLLVDARSSFAEKVLDWILRGPGPLQVLTGNWALIDV